MYPPNGMIDGEMDAGRRGRRPTRCRRRWRPSRRSETTSSSSPIWRDACPLRAVRVAHMRKPARASSPTCLRRRARPGLMRASLSTNSRPRDGRGRTRHRSSRRSSQRRPPARATSDVCVRVHEHHLVARTGHAAPDRSTTRVRSSSACSATAAAPTRRRGSARIREDKSVLDSVREEVARMQRSLGAGDRTTLCRGPRVDSRRGAPDREGRGAEWPGTAGRRPSRRASRKLYDEHVHLMCDLQVLAYQCDLTRIVDPDAGPRVQRQAPIREIGVPTCTIPSRTTRERWRRSPRSRDLTTTM